jgi:hypothetical protein
MSREIEAEAAAMRAAMEHAVHPIGCGHDEDARRLLSAYLSGTGAGRDLLRASERHAERSVRCLREHLAPLVAAVMQGEVPAGSARR